MTRPSSMMLVAFALSTATVLTGCEGELEDTDPTGDVFVDTVAPTVVSISPADAATDVNPASPIVVVFSEPIDETTVSDGAVSLTGPEGALDTAVSLDRATLSLTPPGQLAPGTEYTIRLGTQLADPAGNALAEDFVSSFTTGLRGTPVGEDLLFVGRHDASDPDAVRLSWSGSGFVTRFRGTGVRADLSGGSYLTVIIDGAVQPDPLVVTATSANYSLASGLPSGEHTVEVHRRQEARRSPTTVSAVEVFGEPLDVVRSGRQIEIVGDSWVSGDAMELVNGNCDQRSQNHTNTYGALAARALDAEISNVSLGGISIVGEPMSRFYDRVIGTEPDSTGTIQPADVVFVALGGNDQTDGVIQEGFVAGYVDMLEQVRTRQPGALIACIFPRFDDDDLTARMRSDINTAIATRTAAGDAQVVEVDLELQELPDLGCDDYHPGVRSHEGMSDNMVGFLRAEFGW